MKGRKAPAEGISPVQGSSKAQNMGGAAYQSYQRAQNFNQGPQSRSISPINNHTDSHTDPDQPQTFIFSLLPPEEKKRFMDFLIDNQVEF
jgi:hypothetical protein